MMYQFADLSSRPIYSDRRDYSHSANPIPSPHVDVIPEGWTPPVATVRVETPTTTYRVAADPSAPAAPIQADAPAECVPAVYSIPATDAIACSADLAAAYYRAAERYYGRGDWAAFDAALAAAENTSDPADPVFDLPAAPAVIRTRWDVASTEAEMAALEAVINGTDTTTIVVHPRGCCCGDQRCPYDCGRESAQQRVHDADRAAWLAGGFDDDEADEAGADDFAAEFSIIDHLIQIGWAPEEIDEWMEAVVGRCVEDGEWFGWGDWSPNDAGRAIDAHQRGSHHPPPMYESLPNHLLTV